MRRATTLLPAVALVAAGLVMLRSECWAVRAMGTLVPEFGARQLSRVAIADSPVPGPLGGVESGEVLAVAALACDSEWLALVARRSGEEAERQRGACADLRRRLVRASPRSGDAWLALAATHVTGGRLDDQGRSALALSIRTMPFEAWMAERRVLFAFDAFDALTPDERRRIAVDFAILVMSGHRMQHILARAALDPRAERTALALGDLAGAEVRAWFATQLARLDAAEK